MSDSGQHVIVAANPKSGRTSSRERVSELRQAIIDCGFQCDVVHSLDTLHSRSHALQQSGVLRAVVSAGGDGTAGALANLLSAEIPILLFPLGTENLLAKHLGLAGDLRQTCDVLKHGRPVAMDVGSANGKLFLVMLSCGFDAEVVRQMDAARTGHINRWSYARPIIAALSRYRFPQLPLTLDGNSQEPQFAGWTFVFNVPRYAAGLDFLSAGRSAGWIAGRLHVSTKRNRFRDRLSAEVIPEKSPDNEGLPPSALYQDSDRITAGFRWQTAHRHPLSNRWRPRRRIATGDSGRARTAHTTAPHHIAS